MQKPEAKNLAPWRARGGGAACGEDHWARGRLCVHCLVVSELLKNLSSHKHKGKVFTSTFYRQIGPAKKLSL